ncbi:hypothetical protein BDV26DRAFT_302326 [Aspergillus bertholletiae]|uniref:Rhodopsin domain-containing protein n=1 Tax=Aspergillus bertholletiae TaxID=1226010 RepID=A0A5N7AQJ8_9EURO|nr:hypothetical protein BDV26DRAFT_302326 [Aspergillus bertholletiae]
MSIGVPRGRHALSISIAFTCLATCATALRIYTRAFIVKQLGIDDWTIVLSLVCSWAFFGLFVGEVTYLMGEHIENIPSQILIKQMICFWATVPMYQASLICTKAAILFQYLRVFVTPRMRLACLYLITFLALYGTWTFLTAWLTCVPVRKFWDDSLHGFCFSKKGLWFSNSAVHIFTDVLILVYPMPVVQSLKLPRRQKIALAAVFAIGGFVLVTSILRFQSLLVISQSTDPTYDNPPAAMWSAVECNVAIICACLPSMRALISHLIPRVFSTRSNRYMTKQTDGNFNVTHRTQTTAIQASVADGASDLSMVDLGRPDKSSTLESPSNVQLGEIRVIRGFGRGYEDDPLDDESSVRHLVAN